MISKLICFSFIMILFFFLSLFSFIYSFIFIFWLHHTWHAESYRDQTHAPCIGTMES